jgi:hypothetical protein
LYEISNGPAQEQSGKYELVYRPKGPIVKHFGSIIGDAVNNLREALDYAANSTIAAVGPRRKLYFPVAEFIADYGDSENFKKVKRVFPDLTDFLLTTIKPCKDTNLSLWAAASLCNDNKHNDFVLAIALAEIGGAKFMLFNNWFESPSIHGNASSRCIIIRSNQPIELDASILTTRVEPTFPPAALFARQPVVPTLRNMSLTVKDTLDQMLVFMKPRLT